MGVLFAVLQAENEGQPDFSTSFGGSIENAVRKCHPRHKECLSRMHVCALNDLLATHAEVHALHILIYLFHVIRITLLT